MVYKVWPRNGVSRRWYYDFFRESVNGAIYSYDMEGSSIRSATFVVKEPIPQAMFDHYCFDHELVSEE